MIEIEIMHKDVNEEINPSSDFLKPNIPMNLNKSTSGLVQNIDEKDKIVMI